MEKRSFLLYLGIGFLMTLGVWGLMGGSSSNKIEEAKVAPEETPLLPQELAIPKEEAQPIVSQKVSEPLKKETEVRSVVKKVKKVKMVEEEKEVVHTVAKGETLWGISRQYKTTIEKVMELNELDGMSVSINQKLRIKGKVQVPHEYFVEERVEEVVEVAPVVLAKEAPVVSPQQPQPKGPSLESFTGELLTHEVAAQDTLVTIASKYQTTVAFLKDINGLTEKSQLQEGQILLVPGK
jgi:LysM repeat protein